MAQVQDSRLKLKTPGQYSGLRLRFNAQGEGPRQRSRHKAQDQASR